MNKILTSLAVAGLMATVAVPALAANDAAVLQTPKTQAVKVYVFPGEQGFLGPDGKGHDSVAPTEFVLHKGVPVTFTVINYDDMRHSITAEKLGLNVIINPATGDDSNLKPGITKVTFTPEKTGDFRWHCIFPCDGPNHWAMGSGYKGPDKAGYMAGWIKVL